MKRWLGFALLACLVAICCQSAYAQEKKWVSGTLKDRSGAPVIYATIIEKGTTNGATSNDKGAFRLQVAPNATLVITSVGFTKLEVPASADLNLVMEDNSKGLSEVVVTALGITREKKSLGYSMQEVKANTLVEAHETNITNSLTGVVAGLQVTRSSGGPAASSKINLRGNTSLNGKNQPLIVIDGVPMDNATGVATNGTNDYWNPSLDMGNGLSDLNANDIASMSVLKGPAAAALYGSRAGDGVILITTKTGKRNSGVGITVSSTLGVETFFTRPDMQKTYGQGTNGIFDPISGSSWGPKIAGQELTNWNGKKENMRFYDNAKAFYNTGLSHNENISFQQQLDKTSVYTSLNYLNDKSMIPGTKLSRLNVTSRITSKYGAKDRLSTDFKVQYSNSNSLNRPASGTNPWNYATLMYSMPVTMDITQFKDPVNEFGKMYWYSKGNDVNPYWATKYRLNEDIRNRFILNGSMKYQFTSWLDAEIRAGGDMYTTNTESKTYFGSPAAVKGGYSTGRYTFSELNYSTLITAKKDNLFGKLSGNISVGGNLMKQKTSNVGFGTGSLVVKDLFAIGNAEGSISRTDELTDQRINSLYGTAGLNWDGYLFLDVTGRNDWTSTLAPENRSFFYPSVSLSYLFTEHIKSLPSWLSYGKLRASYAAVGNSLPPYQLYNYFEISQDPNQNTIATRNKKYFNKGVQSELIKSHEFGAEFRFVDNRFGLDFTYYKSNATHQLIDLPLDPAAGYGFRKINAGNIQNSGIEIMADARILNNPKGLIWNIAGNFSMNRNKIIDISQAEGVNNYPLGGFDAVSVVARTGSLYGDIYANRILQRVTDVNSQYYGQLLLNADGLPVVVDAPSGGQYLGNQGTKALVGVTNTFTYKNFSLGFLVDARIGGNIFSTTQLMMQKSGTAAATAPGGERNDLVVGGVVDAGGGKYAPNTKSVTTQQYWNAMTAGNLGAPEINVYDATSIRLRNVQFNYNLPKSVLGRLPVQSAKVGLSCNNVWMISSHMNGLDPESVFAIGSNATGFENGAPPTTRTFLLNLSLSF
ncbi:SusC/RagA family TonB-linked outer membrane protein [Chitinophaga qingshengii]|uniref:SusC/RagA family TonB-linked outer membrane protein n=1 Tax=Chitinophaga qingshengii TaxID=1569794 RepID=A0ABR7TJE1_9BACT|nr:SusC/RagA family TonB-linked outer membrane protein [Chitinophaga qingshengii]MBC9930607.1 SusC/RagA family TonB-linked outer membrane protein [Chitinophaga qingshengii]